MSARSSLVLPSPGPALFAAGAGLFGVIAMVARLNARQR
jgi:hypothetical protein